VPLELRKLVFLDQIPVTCHGGETRNIVVHLQKSVINWTWLRIQLNLHIMWLHTVKFIAKTPKCAALAQEIGFSGSNSCNLPWWWKPQHSCAPPKECNKLDLTADPAKSSHYVTPYSKVYCENAKMRRFSSRNWYLWTKFVQLAMVVKAAT